MYIYIYIHTHIYTCILLVVTLFFSSPEARWSAHNLARCVVRDRGGGGPYIYIHRYMYIYIYR